MKLPRYVRIVGSKHMISSYSSAPEVYFRQLDWYQLRMNWKGSQGLQLELRPLLAR